MAFYCATVPSADVVWQSSEQQTHAARMDASHAHLEFDVHHVP